VYTNTRQQHKNMQLSFRTSEDKKTWPRAYAMQFGEEHTRLFTENSNLKHRNHTLSDKIGSYTKVNKELSLRVKTSKKEKEELRQEVKCLKAQIELYEAAYGPLSPTLIGREEMDMDIDDGNKEIQESDYCFDYNFASSPSSYTYSSS